MYILCTYCTERTNSEYSFMISRYSYPYIYSISLQLLYVLYCYCIECIFTVRFTYLIPILVLSCCFQSSDPIDKQVKNFSPIANTIYHKIITYYTYHTVSVQSV